jgi:hypothetical protein
MHAAGAKQTLLIPCGSHIAPSADTIGQVPVADIPVVGHGPLGEHTVYESPFDDKPHMLPEAPVLNATQRFETLQKSPFVASQFCSFGSQVPPAPTGVTHTVFTHLRDDLHGCCRSHCAPISPGATHTLALVQTSPGWQSLSWPQGPAAAERGLHAPHVWFAGTTQTAFGPEHCRLAPHAAPCMSEPWMSHSLG